MVFSESGKKNPRISKSRKNLAYLLVFRDTGPTTTDCVVGRHKNARPVDRTAYRRDKVLVIRSPEGDLVHEHLWCGAIHLSLLFGK